MKKATYTLIGGKSLTVEYDETAPCRICGKPVIDASMGGTDVCPWCDCGRERPDKDTVIAYEIQNEEETETRTM